MVLLHPCWVFFLQINPDRVQRHVEDDAWRKLTPVDYGSSDRAAMNVEGINSLDEL